MNNNVKDIPPEQIVKLAIATYLLGHMINTPTEGLRGTASKQAKVSAALEYADLLMKG